MGRENHFSSVSMRRFHFQFSLGPASIATSLKGTRTASLLAVESESNIIINYNFFFYCNEVF